MGMHPSSAPVQEPDLEPSDTAIIERVLAGSSQDFALLVGRYNQRLYRVGRAYLRNHDSVEDAMQNAYIKAYRNLSRFQRGSTFSTWLTRIMINECLMALRKQRSRREERIEAETLERIPASQDSTAADVSRLHEMKAILEKAVADLPLAYRTVYLLRDIQQLSTAETAKCLGVSVVAAKVKLHRARALIKEKLLATAAGTELFAYDLRYCNALTRRVMAVIEEEERKKS